MSGGGLQVNPLAGCLPTLATIPVFIGLYRALSNVAEEGLLKEGFFWIPSLGGPTTIAAQKAVRAVHSDVSRGLHFYTQVVSTLSVLGRSAPTCCAANNHACFGVKDNCDLNRPRITITQSVPCGGHSLLHHQSSSSSSSMRVAPRANSLLRFQSQTKA